MSSSQPTVIRSAPHQDALSEFRMFIKGTASGNNKNNTLELTKIALPLLKTLPSVRDAVFDYLCTVFDAATENYIVRIETEIATGKIPPPSVNDEIIISDIHTVLCNFVKNNAEAWAPIISTWSLELLGELSTRYAGRAHISTGLNETLQLWMSCRATRTLINITTQCLTCLINSDTEACISALLDTSVKHSPNFDWVVAHVGSCFPNTVITRVLSCGLKDFCQNKSYEQGCESPKLKSVVGILGHLAGSHCDDIRKALLDLFNWSLKPVAVNELDSLKQQKKATVPFLLHLSNLSSTLLSSICNDIKHTITPSAVVELCNYTNDWCKYFGTPEALEDLVVSLILKCESGGTQIISLLLDCISTDKISDESVKQTVKETSREMLEYILQEIDSIVREQVGVNILRSFSEEISEIHEMLLGTESVRSQTAARIIIYLGHNNPSILINSATFLFQSANCNQHLTLLIKILTDELIDKTAQPYADKGGYFSVVLEQVLSKNLLSYSFDDHKIDVMQMWNNLLKLLMWQKYEDIPVLESKIISRALESNLSILTTVFGSGTSYEHTLAEILKTLGVPAINTSNNYTPPISVILNFTRATVNYFFICCKEEGTTTKIKGFKNACDILKNLCLYSKVSRILALRELLERSLFGSENVLFGAKKKNFNDFNDTEKHLLKQNKKISKTIPLTKHSSVFNGGIVGTGKRKANVSNELPEDLVDANTAEIIKVIKACCSLPPEVVNKNTSISLDSITQVSLLLVQFVSPDVMYNGLPWPEEEFSKVTIERDLFIRRMFTNTPLLWELLTLVAVYRPALCYCSVLLRALTATLIHQWNSMGDQSKSTDTDSYKSLMQTTVKVIDIMALGQLLPFPLSGIRDVLPYLKCFEIVSILRECIWCYMRDHIPSPALFNCDTNGLYWRDPSVSKPPEAYTNTLRIIMQRNIKTVGHLYAQMFINVSKSE